MSASSAATRLRVTLRSSAMPLRSDFVFAIRPSSRSCETLIVATSARWVLILRSRSFCCALASASSPKTGVGDRRHGDHADHERDHEQGEQEAVRLRWPRRDPGKRCATSWRVNEQASSSAAKERAATPSAGIGAAPEGTPETTWTGVRPECTKRPQLGLTTRGGSSAPGAGSGERGRHAEDASGAQMRFVHRTLEPVCAAGGPPGSTLVITASARRHAPFGEPTRRQSSPGSCPVGVRTPVEPGARPVLPTG